MSVPMVLTGLRPLFAPDTTQKTMPMSYARRGLRGKAEPTKEGIRTAPGGHIWDAALLAGKTLRNYGFSAVNLPEPPPTAIQIGSVTDPVPAPHTAMNFRQHHRAFSDQIRMQVVIDDLRKWEREGGMPDLTLITAPHRGMPTGSISYKQNDVLLVGIGGERKYLDSTFRGHRARRRAARHCRGSS